MSPQRKKGNEQKTRIINFIAAYRSANHGLSPAFREMADGLGISRTTVEHHVKSLIRDGQIVRGPGSHRSLIPKELSR